IAVPLEPPPPPPDRPGAQPQDLGGLDPRQRPCKGSNDNLLSFHGALHGAGRVGHGHLPGGQSCHAGGLERSSHVALVSGQIMYLQHRSARTLATRGGLGYPPEPCEVSGSPVRAIVPSGCCASAPTAMTSKSVAVAPSSRWRARIPG